MSSPPAEANEAIDEDDEVALWPTLSPPLVPELVVTVLEFPPPPPILLKLLMLP
jgi:hypothetical protein